MSLVANLYTEVKSKLGTMPLVVCPAEKTSHNGADSYWVLIELMEGIEATRVIIWLKGGETAVSEAEEPDDVSCPKFFLELVPNIENMHWRTKVLWWHLERSVTDNEDRLKLSTAFQDGILTRENNLPESENPYDVFTIFHLAFSYGWANANTTY